ncbi:MAG TPA: hypothetical protein VHV51_05675 [Polyangiaceae bacterium]|jgi:anti-sigma factor RsiW|nr:hypothetical protein [Polyangiaceae bacterium]
MSECQEFRGQMLDAMRDRLPADEAARFALHRESCAECRQIFERERALERALDKRPSYALPTALRDRLTASVTAATHPASTKPKRDLRRILSYVAPSAAAVMLLLFLARLWANPNQELVSEAVNDHLRVIYAEHPIEIASGGIHQVKPWFTGRLDFAPQVSFSGDDEFPLEGGAVALFVDRKAATFIFKHKLHTISLFVFRSDGLSFPLRSNATIGALAATASHLRGFNTLVWRDGDLGYALVSDVDPNELVRLGLKINAR